MTSTLLERYLAEINRHLPLGPERDDIIAEISDELQSRIESGEGSEYEVIKAYGWPRYVAARYKAHQYLIGPTLYPLYLYVMRFALIAVVGIVLFGSAFAALVTKNPDWFAQGVGTLWQTFFFTIGMCTTLFVVIERLVKNPIRPFDPSTLPSAEDRRLPRYKSGFEFMANFCTILVLLFGGPWLAKIIAPLTFTSAWQPAWYATLAGTAIICGAAFATYLSPSWTKLRHVAQIVADVVMISGCWMMLRSGGPYITQASPAIEVMVQWSLIVVIVTLAIAGAVSLWKLLPFTVLRGPASRGTSA